MLFGRHKYVVSTVIFIIVILTFCCEIVQIGIVLLRVGTFCIICYYINLVYVHTNIVNIPLTLQKLSRPIPAGGLMQDCDMVHA